ncbi:MAG: MCE family protein [Acidimicrobiales bacterium]|nr:MCE family protein [Acidimicrobiales bacterium]
MRRLLILLVLALSATACDIQTATAPGGDLTLYAEFDDAQDLTAGHYVEMSNVVIGSVGELGLDGYRARARLDIVDGRDIPQGTRAVIRRTSLLGAHYVDLIPPEEFDPESGPFLGDDDEIEDTASQLDVEQLAGQAAVVLGAVDANAVSSTVNAADEALAGRGGQLNQLIAKSSDVVGTLRSQQDALISAIDGLAAVGEQFAPRSPDLVALLDSVDEATSAVAVNRDRAVVATQSLIALAGSVDANVLAPHTERIIGLLDQTAPVLGALAARSEAVTGLFEDIAFFNEVFPTVQANGQVLIQAWLDPTVLVGGELDVTDPASLLVNLLNGLL